MNSRPRSNYEKLPAVATTRSQSCCSTTWEEICGKILTCLPLGVGTVCVECYPGADTSLITEKLCNLLKVASCLSSDSCLLSETELRKRFDHDLSDDPVFGFMRHVLLEEFFDQEKTHAAASTLRDTAGIRLVIGTGASLIAIEPDLLLYVDMPRWELQERQRRGQIGNLGIDNANEPSGNKYKRAFFLDWRVADRHKLRVAKQVNFFIDATRSALPRMLAARDYFEVLEQAICGPIRLVPIFDPGPWGGQWMKQVFDLPTETVNFAWCFDCVPEENSLLLQFDNTLFELPALNLVLFFPRDFLGDTVYSRFGREFPIRFDLLDTMGGGNLSLQVHPLTEYIQLHFGMHYTQDESYYILDAESGAQVYLGLKDDVDASRMIADVKAAQRGYAFPVHEHIHSIPVKKHDHLLIPAGTVHCSGAGAVVLEISATPYIFTFKMWDWDRLGLDGLPRPLHPDHAIANIQFNRVASWANEQLVNQINSVDVGDGWREERTGLHQCEFIETRRHWFTRSVEHDTRGTVHVLNLIEGEAVVIESPSLAFAPFVIHYAETFIVPAQVGRYTIRPLVEGQERMCATIKAHVRDG